MTEKFWLTITSLANHWLYATCKSFGPEAGSIRQISRLRYNTSIHLPWLSITFRPTLAVRQSGYDSHLARKEQVNCISRFIPFCLKGYVFVTWVQRYGENVIHLKSAFSPNILYCRLVKSRDVKLPNNRVVNTYKESRLCSTYHRLQH